MYYGFALRNQIDWDKCFLDINVRYASTKQHDFYAKNDHTTMLLQ